MRPSALSGPLRSLAALPRQTFQRSRVAPRRWDGLESETRPRHQTPLHPTRLFQTSAIHFNSADSTGNNSKPPPPPTNGSASAVSGGGGASSGPGSHHRDNIFQSDISAADYLDDTEVVWRGPGFERDLTQSFAGVAREKFPDDVIKVLLEPLNPEDVEILPSDGVPYLPEIKFRRVLNRAFGPGAWGLVPRGKHTLIDKTLTREYALFCMGRFVSQARGMMEAYDKSQLPNATEGVKSNALTRCCKDLGIGSELWDPVWVREFRKTHAVEVWCTHMKTKQKIRLWRRKDRKFEYPYEEARAGSF
ncbi:Mgm101p-domain-containing protein [Gonapodya prolifera JEL478]|uniref:Mitochondrial genome maintenance protein MGM101 n=1 Tax=Gonapodya prolifera (strain JEL478) TaxID=1344416 RepID=A0A139ALQ5_GONPJ|nr:Mgm101p-domain-containing protein [Gonapodya prolifera JEL478]|eukprot:KXS17618.1 Mgm101p-domain-containing protein [Gonapodya prolifera JEL478]